MTTRTNTPQHSNNDGIDLFELVQALWQQKWLILGITAVATLLAVVYVLLVPPAYQTSASVMPPRAADIAPANLGRDRADIERLSIESAYAIFTRNLTSQTTRRWFFEEYYRPFLKEQGISGTRDSQLERMKKALRVSVPDAQTRPDNYEVQVTLSDPELAAEFANLYVEEVHRRSLRDLEMNTLAQITNKLRALEEHISALRSSATTLRLDRVARLQEALSVAEAIGLEVPEVSGGRTQVSVGSSDSALVSEGSMLFLNGTKAIRAELELLKARKNDDPFINELRDLQQQISLLNLIEPLPELVRLFALDSAADIPENPLKPNKVMIVALGAVFGGMLAGVVALVRIAAAARRRALGKQTGVLGS
ncbi:LPS O-antigen chain length determinant protein WzzB [Halopseudomonas laoshanensis]|uniref:LPS O-antigen chain length determinant protein WzzB n=1 Tax=Halopseudomonas laoshanensis TaxID=2268758 RepID=UPI0037353F71